jgi:1-deoxy-D-xylulose-5-phosphate reductoisomerase
VLNAANEVAVHAFLAGRLPFLGIAETIERTLQELGCSPVRAFESLYEADRQAREVAEQVSRSIGVVG